ncbi:MULTISPECIES: VWA domain-containing protein [unclassified Microcoleus]|uniref:vWA domain-containing protein n=1 Tax=unclassified Microcoleus TaxID=2642155 RepID=UPI0025FD81BB|nr:MULTISPECIES: VWA domain-containing protein [unclassified Microcoleus]
MATNNIEVVFSFDTTGSMYPCLTQVRRKIKETVTRLLDEIPGIRIGIIAHGDYCDAGSTYVTKHLDLSGDVGKICNFVENVEPTGGGDAPECCQ